MADQYDLARKAVPQHIAFVKKYKEEPVPRPKHDANVADIFHVTICCQGIEGRGPLFTHPVLSALLKTTWLDLTQSFTSIILDEIMIMPDHVHGLIWLNQQPELAYKRMPLLSDVMRVYKSKVATSWIAWVKTNEPLWCAKIWQEGYDKQPILKQNVAAVRKYLRDNPTKLYKKINMAELKQVALDSQ
jgi:REP element-mobilizing transposase RayT